MTENLREMAGTGFRGRNGFILRGKGRLFPGDKTRGEAIEAENPGKLWGKLHGVSDILLGYGQEVLHRP